MSYIFKYYTHVSFYDKSKEGISHVSVLTRSSYFCYPVQFLQSVATPSGPFVDPDSTLNRRTHIRKPEAKLAPKRRLTIHTDMNIKTVF